MLRTWSNENGNHHQSLTVSRNLQLCRNDHLAAVHVEQLGRVLCVEQSEKPTMLQLEELGSVPNPIPELLSLFQRQWKSPGGMFLHCRSVNFLVTKSFQKAQILPIKKTKITHAALRH